MKKQINGIVYDTETAYIDKKFTYGAPGDPFGYEETLYITADGRHFIYTNGGKHSKYTGEDIMPIEHCKVRDWVMSH